LHKAAGCRLTAKLSCWPQPCQLATNADRSLLLLLLLPLLLLLLLLLLPLLLLPLLLLLLPLLLLLLLLLLLPLLLLLLPLLLLHGLPVFLFGRSSSDESLAGSSSAGALQAKHPMDMCVRACVCVYVCVSVSLCVCVWGGVSGYFHR
jgi:hypothetical protein